MNFITTIYQPVFNKNNTSNLPASNLLKLQLGIQDKKKISHFPFNHLNYFCYLNTNHFLVKFYRFNKINK